VAGLAESSGSLDGLGSEARFNYPGGLAVDSADDVYVADTSNHAIRKGVKVCSCAIDPTTASWGVTGGAGSASVTTVPGCAWTAASSAPWITVTSGGSGNGNGSVGYTVAVNAGAARTGTITMAGRTLTINQEPVTYALTGVQVGHGYGNRHLQPGRNRLWR